MQAPITWRMRGCGVSRRQMRRRIDMSKSCMLRLMIMLVLLPGFALNAPGKRIQVYAHRGARPFAPENTLPAYRTCLRIGADWMDMDVVLTRDNEVLLCHDPVLN